MPLIYPFIVNDPGQGAQAKRRMSAVVLDHLTPPLTQADTHGVMAMIESLMDEYFEAAGMDKNRSAALLSDILEQAERAGITADCGIAKDDAPDEKLLKLDNFLCDLKRATHHEFAALLDHIENYPALTAFHQAHHL